MQALRGICSFESFKFSWQVKQSPAQPEYASFKVKPKVIKAPKKTAALSLTKAPHVL